VLESKFRQVLESKYRQVLESNDQQVLKRKKRAAVAPERKSTDDVEKNQQIMNYCQLGHSDLRISVIGFGCMSLGDGKENAARVMGRALDLGINFFDTADLYDRGLNEEMVGRILQGNRERIVLATKVGNQWRKPDGRKPDGRKSDGRPSQRGADGPTERGAGGPAGWDWNPRPAYIIKAVEDSLTRLRTDRIDLYQLHGGTIHDPIDDTIGAFEQLRQQGKILSYGISSIRPDVIREYAQRSNIVSVMMQYSLLDRRPEESSLELLRIAGIGVLVRGAVAKGLLVDKPAADYLNYSAEEVAKMADAVKVVSRPRTGMGSYTHAPGAGSAIHSDFGPDDTSKTGAGNVGCSGSNNEGGRSAAQTAIRFVLYHPAVSSAVVGLRTIAQVEEAAKTMETSRLTEEDLSILRGALAVNRYVEHR
jgi:aryl-alcohol dehydrogenase-like predicted oxidoreductase